LRRHHPPGERAATRVIASTLRFGRLEVLRTCHAGYLKSTRFFTNLDIFVSRETAANRLV
jgi:hypothetical protein